MDSPGLLVVDPHRVVAAGIAAALRPFFHVVDEICEINDLEAVLRRHRPQVVIVSLPFEDGDPLTTLQRYAEHDNPTPVCHLVAYMTDNSSSHRDAAVLAGVEALVPGTASIQDLRFAIEAVLRGENYGTNAPPHPSHGYPALLARIQVTIDTIPLSRRQVEILLLLRVGLTRRETAERLNLSERGIDYHLNRVKSKLRLSRTRLLLNWVEEHREAFMAAASDLNLPH